VLAGIPMRAFECPILTADRRERQYAWHSDRVVDTGGAVSGIVHVGQDITEQKEVQRALLRAKESAEAADRIKSVFLASMSHELRTPLNSIIGFTGILVQGLSGPLNERQLDQLRRVYGSAKHLLALISDVMDISRIEAGRFESVVEVVDLSQIMVQVLESLRPQAAEKNLALSAAVPAGISVTTDKRRLTQCLINLIGNALKYTERGRVSIAALERGAFVDIAITDTGIGIDAAQQAKLFKPFERLNSELLAKVPGTGLGLYLTKKIATEILGGGVAVQSSPGMGSTFTLTIARSVAPTAAA
jgi:signal transduction histidine kinase